MRPLKNLINEKFGYLTVIGISDKKDSGGRSLHLCKCICGKNITATTNKLKSVKSCGCINHNAIRDKNVAWNQKYASYKRDAVNRNMVFDLTKEDFYNIASKNCFYCNSEPQLWSPYISKDGKPFKRYESKVKIDEEYMYSTRVLINGIDRLDSKKGYLKENSVPCCGMCNYMKNIYSVDQFFNQIKKISKYHNL